ncbi:MAG: CAP domain-containing protein [Dethiobacteria bacterium]|nr:CAP domain-containing protein [Dethiobacteria bacterium]
MLPVLLYVTEGGTSAVNTGGISDGHGYEKVKTGEEMINFKALLYDGDKAAELIVSYLEKLDAEAEEDHVTDSETGNASTKDPVPAPAPQPTAATDQVAAASVEAPAPVQVPSVDNNSKEQQMINLINQARSNAGLPALQASSDLTKVARAKSKDMVDKNYFSHTSPTYGSLTSMLQHFGISYSAAGENLAMNSSGSVGAAHESLMNSAGHRSNILEPRFSYVGVGIQVKSDGSHYYTQIYTSR